jgi:hypothetical protein
VIRKVHGFRITRIPAKGIGVLLAEISAADARAEASGDFLSEVGLFAEWHSDEAEEHCAPAAITRKGRVGCENAPLPPKKQEKLRDEGQ